MSVAGPVVQTNPICEVGPMQWIWNRQLRAEHGNPLCTPTIAPIGGRRGLALTVGGRGHRIPPSFFSDGRMLCNLAKGSYDGH